MSGASLKILVIDDDPAVCDIMSRSLTKLGFEVIIGRSGTEGLQLAKRFNPVLITLDVMMPGIDGWNVLKQLKAKLLGDANDRAA